MLRYLKQSATALAAGDANGHAIHDVFLDPFGERRTGEADDAQWRVVQLRCNGFILDGQPNLERSLGRQVMETESRK